MITRMIAGLLAAAFSLAAGLAHAEKRVALVIGNGAYVNTPALTNPVNDAEDMAAALQRVGFTVQVERDLTKRGMEGALARFARTAEDADAALFFYAGHGIQYRGTNFLMPVDARLEDDISINYELLRIDEVLFGLERARGVKLLVLDACRNNPLLDRLLRRGATRGAELTRGLARIDTARGMVVAYSTQPDQVAVDGTGRNSPFTGALVKYIDEPGLEVGSLFRRVAIEVDRATGGRQLPELSITLRGEFYLNTRESDLQAWGRVRASDDPNQLTDFIRRFPSSVLATEVRRRLEVVEREQAERARIERERAENERIVREREARELARRELARREQAERERAERERLAQQQLTREQAERIAREQAAREQTAREQALREQIERERLQAERVERERLAREQVERERLAREQTAREQAERERIARATAERERLAREERPNQQIAMLPPANGLPPANASASSGALVSDIKKELKRVGCFAGLVDENWTDARSSVAQFARHTKLAAAPAEPTSDFLELIRRMGPRVCPVDCGLGTIERQGVCVVKACPRGHVLTREGECEDRRPRPKTAARTPAARAAPSAEPGPRESAPRGGGGGGGGQQAVICGNRGCRTGSWSPTRAPGQHCRKVFNNRHQYFCR
jgi:hypothetical protein